MRIAGGTSRTFLLTAVLAGCAAAPEAPKAVEPEPILVLTPEGLEGLPATGPINAFVIQRACPELVVVASAYGTRYAVRHAGETLALVEPLGSTGYRAKLLSALTTAPRNIRVGDLFSEVASLSDVQCRRGAGEWASEVYCTSPATQNIVYGFDAAGIATGDCTAKCVVSDTSVLQSVPIRMIDWEL